MTAILVYYHNASDSGFASRRHDVTFAMMAREIAGSFDDVHFAYRNLNAGRPDTLPSEIKNVIEFDPYSSDINNLTNIENYIKKNNIKIAFGFDQPVRLKAYKCMRRGGAQYLISYYGCPMSSINKGLKLIAKRIDVALSLWQPDHYIFQSEGMRKTATHGRGIPLSRTSVVYSGVDTDLFTKSQKESRYYAHDTFNISRDISIVFFSGNMEPRKGIDVIMKCAIELVDRRGRDDVHFLLAGNRWDQEDQYRAITKGSRADTVITFAGYRTDIPALMRSSDIGIIASTTWDSYPMSAVEMAASGIPILVSDIPGLRETIKQGTGLTFSAGDHIMAADHITYLLDNESLRLEMGDHAREYVLKNQTRQHQADALIDIIRRVANLEPRA